jgi:hypothetical protein
MKKLNQTGWAHWIVPALVVLVVAFTGAHLLAASHAATPPSTSSTCSNVTFSSAYAPSCGALWGFYSSPQAGKTEALESMFGRQFDIVKRYYDMSNTHNGQFPTANDVALAHGGRILHLTWDARIYGNTPGPGLPQPAAGCQAKGTHVYSYNQIINGNTNGLDNWIQTRAQAVAALGTPVIMDVFHEPDNPAAACANPGTPAEGAAAYRHIITVFRNYYSQHHLTNNIAWAYVTTGYLGPAGSRARQIDAQFYPGDSYIDWIGWDPYVHTGGNNSKSAEQSFSEYYHWVDAGNLSTCITPSDPNCSVNKPRLLGEYGVGQIPQPKINAYIANIVPALKNLPKLKAIEYYDSRSWSQFTGKYQGASVQNNTTIANFKAAGADPYVNIYNGGHTVNNPAVSSVSPTTGPAAGGTTVTITTSNFAAGTPTVTFGGVTASHVSRHGNTVTATSPAHPGGNVDVVVKVGSASANSVNGFTYQTPPPPQRQVSDLVITSITASPVTPLSGQAVTFSATVKNQGDLAVPSSTTFGAGFTVDNTKVSWNAGDSHGLAAGASIVITANAGPGKGTWMATPGNHTVTASVNNRGKVTESNTTNDSFSTQLVVPVAAPTHLKTTGVTSSSVALSWRAPASAPSTVAYDVLRNGQTIAHTSSLSYTDSNVVANTSYNYKVSSSVPGAPSSTTDILQVHTRVANCSSFEFWHWGWGGWHPTMCAQ